LPGPVAAITEILADRAASAWLKESLERALTRDPVDALNDALLLASVLDAQLRAVFDLEDA
jgi:hypothetical protein